MTEEEIKWLFTRNEKLQEQRVMREHEQGKRKESSTKTVTFVIDETLYKSFQGIVEKDGLTVSAILRAAVISYTFGILKFNGDRLKSVNEALFNTPEGQRAAFEAENKRIDGKRGPKAKEKPLIDRKKVGARDENGDLIHWVDLDHTDRPLKEFDYPDNIDPTTESRKMLELDWSLTDDSGSFKNTLFLHYDQERDKVDARTWEVEYWNFCRYCAKKFLTLNGMPEFVYSEDYLRNELCTLRDQCEADYAVIFKLKTERENSK